MDLQQVSLVLVHLELGHQAHPQQLSAVFLLGVVAVSGNV